MKSASLMGTLDGIERISRLGEELYHTDNYVGIVEGSAYHQSSPDSISSLSGRFPTVKLKIPGKLFLKSNPELLLHSSYSF